MKRFLCCFGAFVLAGAVFAQDAVAIVDASRNRIDAATVLTQSKMVITAKSGSTTERVINQYSKDDKNGNSRVIIEFLSPASVKGTRFLTIAKQGGNDDQWIFLPELNRVRRIASSEGSGSFMGTDMSYNDLSAISSRDADKDTHKLLREENYAGGDCYVIESTPKDPSFEYSKMISWIDKANQVCRKMEMYDRQGKLKKLMEVQKLEDQQGYLTPMVTKLSTVDAGTATTITVQKIQYNANIPEGAFTTRYLETGRP
jgi:outer membrane lipoprotein-sorting protein